MYKQPLIKAPRSLIEIKKELIDAKSKELGRKLTFNEVSAGSPLHEQAVEIERQQYILPQKTLSGINRRERELLKKEKKEVEKKRKEVEKYLKDNESNIERGIFNIINEYVDSIEKYEKEVEVEKLKMNDANYDWDAEMGRRDEYGLTGLYHGMTNLMGGQLIASTRAKDKNRLMTIPVDTNNLNLLDLVRDSPLIKADDIRSARKYMGEPETLRDINSEAMRLLNLAVSKGTWKPEKEKPFKDFKSYNELMYEVVERERLDDPDDYFDNDNLIEEVEEKYYNQFQLTDDEKSLINKKKIQMIKDNKRKLEKKRKEVEKYLRDTDSNVEKGIFDIINDYANDIEQYEKEVLIDSIKDVNYFQNQGGLYGLSPDGEEIVIGLQGNPLEAIKQNPLISLKDAERIVKDERTTNMAIDPNAPLSKVLTAYLSQGTFKSKY